jgi:hypothetical protein
MDLTDRECAYIIGGLIGSLALMTDVETIRIALKWWVDNTNWDLIHDSIHNSVGSGPNEDKG